MSQRINILYPKHKDIQANGESTEQEESTRVEKRSNFENISAIIFNVKGKCFSTLVIKISTTNMKKISIFFKFIWVHLDAKRT